MAFKQTDKHRFGKGSYHQIGLVRGQFGNVPFVKKNFELVMVAIVVISVMPPLIEWWRSRKGPPAPPVS